MKRKLYQIIANKIVARENCINNDNNEWYENHTTALEDIEKNYLPSGSGIDNGCKFDLDKSNENRIVINSSYHCMDESGYYDGWIDFTVTIKASLLFGITLDIKGQFSKKSSAFGLKDMLYDQFDHVLQTEIENI